MSELRSRILHAIRRWLMGPRWHRLGRTRMVDLVDNGVWLLRYSAWLRERGVTEGYDTRWTMWPDLVTKHAIDETPFTYLEFGVARGSGIRWWSENTSNPDARMVGFDTFMGLPENWGPLAPRGTYGTAGRVPEIEDARVSFEIGMFQETLGPYLARTPELSGQRADRAPGERRLIVHFDADLYSSTLYCLVMLRPLLEAGDWLLFDDFSPRYLATEFRAFCDFESAFPLKYEILGAATDYRQVALRLLETPRASLP